MASRKTLNLAILKLRDINNTLYGKLHDCTSNEEIENIRNKITKNESMILDFEFQLKNNDE